MINNFSDFCRELTKCGFSMGGGNAKGVFALIPYSWENQDCVDSPVKWHTGDRDTDPWEWRMRVLEERDDIAYSKLFFKSSGFITKEWYPFFYAVRRQGISFDEAYESGTVSAAAKRIYTLISENTVLPIHELKTLGGFSGKEGSVFDRAVTDLQMRMFITMCGKTQKKNKHGEYYGWNTTVFTTVESFWAERSFTVPELSPAEGYDRIASQILALNPSADAKACAKFIKG